MNVLSLFDGCGMALQALKETKIGVDSYYSSEIDKYAIKIAKNNHPEIISVGDINNIGVYASDKIKCDCCNEPWCDIHEMHFADCSCVGVSQLQDLEIDLIIFGSPCTNLSSGKWFAKTNGVGFSGDSQLFYKALEILELVQPKWFLMENVASMKQEHQEEITKRLGVQPVKIDSRAFVPQMRKRLYWCNWKVEIPRIKTHNLDNYLSVDFPKIKLLSEKELEYMNASTRKNRTRWSFANHSDSKEGYTKCLTANLKRGVPYNVLIDRRFKEPLYRKFLPTEIERLQGLPINYTAGVSDYQRFKMLGNGFNIQTIKYILEQNSDFC